MPLRLPATKNAQYFIEAFTASARRLGHLGFKTTHTRAKQWTAQPVDMRTWPRAFYQPGFIADAAPLFEVYRQQGVCKWMTGDGHDLAIEYDSDQEHRLLVTASLRREMLDALVAMWCCRVWEQSVDRQYW